MTVGSGAAVAGAEEEGKEEEEDEEEPIELVELGRVRLPLLFGESAEESKENGNKQKLWLVQVSICMVDGLVSSTTRIVFVIDHHPTHQYTCHYLISE